MCRIVSIRGKNADIPVNIKNVFNLPFSFLEMNVRIIPSIRNRSPNTASTVNKSLAKESSVWAKKKVNNRRIKVTIKE